MTCEWAEGYLSAYLDDALDPQLRKDVGAHIEQCAHCQALAAEYRRNDQLLSTMAPVEPTDALRQRIFESPAFAALARDLERETADAPPRRAAARRAPLYVRALVPLAAVLTLTLGAALLFRQGLLPFGAASTSQKQTHTIGGPGSFNLPLSAGPRVVFLNGGALWSVAEYAPNDPTGAPGTPQRLTAPGAHVSAWRVSPLTAPSGGARIAYIDNMTGAVHIVHSDGQADSIVGFVASTQAPSADFWSSAAGRAALTSLNWSPDGSRLAYVVATDNGGTQAHVVTLSGASFAIATPSAAPISQLAWSADNQSLAYTTVAGASATVVVWHGDQQATTTVTASPSDMQATVSQIGWSGSTVTWSASDGGVIVGVYALPSHASAATQLTPSGASYRAADFTSARGGVWLLAGNGALSEAHVASGSVTQVAATSGDASAVSWSSNGSAAAITLGSQLDIWSASTGLTTLAHGTTSQPVWSPSGAAIAVTEGPNVMVYRISDEAATQIERLTANTSVIALAWATDERNLALAESHGMLMVTADGYSQTLLTSRLAEGGALNWSVAR